MSDESPSAENEARSTSTMLKEGGKLSVLTLISRILGLVREMTKASFIGTGFLAEAFTVAYAIPNFMRRLFAENSVTVAFIPTFSGYLGEENNDKRKEFLSATFTVLLLFVTVTVLLGIAATPWIVRLFDSDPIETAVLTRMMFPFLALVSVAAFLQGILNSIGVFTPSALGPIIFNLCFIVVPSLIGAFSVNPARGMAVGVIIGGIFQALCQLPAVLKAGFRFGLINPRVALRNPGMRKVLALIAPTILGMAAYQLNDIVCTAVATSVQAAASIQYSMRLLELVIGIFAVSAGTVVLPRLSRAALSLDWSSFSDDLGRVMRTMILVSLPVTFFSLVAGTDIVTVVYRRGEFGDASVAATSSAFLFHIIGLAFITLNRVIAPAFYARSDSKTPAWAGIASFLLNIGLALLLAKVMGGPGIALALSISSASNTVFLLIVLRRQGLPGMREAISDAMKYFLKIILFSLIAAVPAWLLRPFFDHLFKNLASPFLSSVLLLVLETFLFGAIGIGLLVVSHDEAASTLVRGLGGQRKALGGGKKVE